MSNNEHDGLAGAATYAAAYLAEKQAEKDRPWKRLTPQELEEKREREKKEMRLRGGLAGLQIGKPPTKLEAPLVGEYIAGYEKQIADLKEQLYGAQADAAYWEAHYGKIAIEWNATCEALDSLGIHLFGGHNYPRWQWTCTASDGRQGEGEEADAATAMKTALLWWRNAQQ